MKIRDVIRMIEADGWFLVATKGSHRQFKHDIKPGRVTIAGHPGDDLAPGTLNSVLQTGPIERPEVMTMHRFLIVIEHAGANYSAYSPDLPGCVATGATVGEVERNMYDAIHLHVQGLNEDKLPIPEGRSIAEYLVVEAP